MGIRLGFAMCGSFCNFQRAIEAMERLASSGAEILPIMSQNAYETDTRFGRAVDFRSRVRLICGNEIISTIAAAEPIGPQNMCDLLCIAPCTGNTLAKLAQSITDTPVTMAAKSHLRSGKPVLIALSTNDGLAGSMKHLAALMTAKNYYFTPMRQDDPAAKPSSLVADYDMLEKAISAALQNRQLRPVFE